jgi:hypothetical protein
LSNPLSNEVKAQIFSQESDDPFLTLVTLTHTTFTVRLVNNSTDIISNGNTFTAFPMKIRTPIDDGESTRDFTIVMDNVSLDLIVNMRSVTGEIGVQVDFILASIPDVIQMSHDNLLVRSITYNASTISVNVVLDNFLSVSLTSEKYTPSVYPGMFR